MSGDRHVCSNAFDISCVRMSSVIQASCHCSLVRLLVFTNVAVKFSMMSEFFSKKVVWNFSMLSFGIGLSILMVLLGGGGCVRLISLLLGMCKVTGKWSELRLLVVSVVEVRLWGCVRLE